jgi:hypothetical protein
MTISDKKSVEEGTAAIDTVTEAVLSEKLADALTPGFWAEFAPDEAELAGAFEEAALGESEAAASGIDLPSPDQDNVKERGS